MTRELPVPETKLQAVCLALTRLVDSLGPEAKLPTVRELAASLPASVATLDAALRALEARGLIVRRHGVGLFVAPTVPRHRIALLCRPEFFSATGSSPFWGLLVEHAQRRAAAAGEALAFWFADGCALSEGQQAALLSRHFHGVVGVGLGASVVLWLERNAVPFVAFAGPGERAVAIDSDALAALGRAALTELGCGSLVDAPRSEAGVCAQESGYRWAMALLAGPRETWPDGIVSADDMVTAGVLGACHARGASVGAEVQVATHHNAGSPVLLGWEAEIVRLVIDPAEIVVRLFARLEEQLVGRVSEKGTEMASIRTVVGDRVIGRGR